MRINQNLENLLLNYKIHIAYFSDESIIEKNFYQKFLHYTIFSNIDISRFQDHSLFSVILVSCVDLGLNIHCKLPFATLNKKVDQRPKLLTIGQLETFLNLYVLDLILETSQDLIYLSQSEDHLHHN